MTKANRTKIIPVLNTFIALCVSITLVACSSSRKAPVDSVEHVKTKSSQDLPTKKLESNQNSEISYPYSAPGTLSTESITEPTTSDIAIQKIKNIDENSLNTDELSTLNLAKASIFSVRNQHTQNLASLKNISTSKLTQEQTSHYYWIKARSLYLTRDYTGALESLATRNDLLEDNQQKENNENMMLNIKNSLSKAQVKSIQASTQNTSLFNWLSQASQSELSPLLKYSPLDTDKTTRKTIYSNWSGSSPKKIALLLPLSSRFSKSALEFKRGFDQAHTLNPSFKPIIQVYDTDTADIRTLISFA